MYSLVVSLLLSLLLSPSTSLSQIHYVKPNNSFMNCYNQPCLTLDQYVKERDRYFTNGSTFIFLAGNHSVHTQVDLINVDHINLQAEENGSDINIMCTNAVTFRCENVTDFHINGLTFLLHFSSRHNLATALSLLSSKDVTVSNSTFQGYQNISKTSASVIISNYSTVAITGCHFIQSEGVAITIQGGFMTLAGNRFIRNRRGAISCKSCSLNITGKNRFTENSNWLGTGGAIHVSLGNLFIRGNAYFHHNKAQSGGAIYLFISNALINGENITFRANVARIDGGAIFMNSRHGTTVKHVLISANFNTNRGEEGAAVYVYHGRNLTFKDINVTGNSKQAIYIRASSVNFTGTNIFSKNEHSALTAVCKTTASSCNTVTFQGNNTIKNNERGLKLVTSTVYFKGTTTILSNHGAVGAGILGAGSRVKFSGFTIFYNNSASEGGIIDLQRSRVSFYGITKFTDNVGETAIINTFFVKMSFYSNSTFINNTAKIGSVINASFHGKLKFANVTTFIRNRGTTGSVITIKRCQLSFTGISTIINNTAITGGVMYMIYGTLSLADTVTFTNNTAHEDGGALYALGTRITIRSGKINFSFNSARRGGVMYLTTGSTLFFYAGTSIFTSHNRAYEYGGVIYHKDNTVAQVHCNYWNGTTNKYEELPYCFLEFFTPVPAIYIHSYHNSAGKDGSFMYGGLLDKCRFKQTLNIYYESSYFMKMLNITSRVNGTRVIGSQPFQLSLCGDIEDNNLHTRSVVAHRGQEFTVPVVAFSQGHIVTSAMVTATVSTSSRLELSQTSQFLPKKCFNLTYRLYSTKSFDKLILYPDGPCRDTGLARVVVKVTLLPCPDVFTQEGEQCVCEERLQPFGANCTIGEEMYVILKASSKIWMSTLYRNGSYQGLILYKSCPTEYCKTGTVTMNLDDLDAQCDLNRSGLLCGACTTNYSLVLGSSQCATCSNSYLALLLLFILAGIVLVVFLTFLKLTVATGMINSLILYANFIQANRKVFFPENRINILTVFIAWMNLDLGFKICFFAGMDAYAQTWLQYVFPVYVWTLMGLIILSCRYSIIMSKLIGSNPVAVLATLLLMSYNKILKIIIEVFSSVDLDFPKGQKVTVWLKDANVPYLQSKHLALSVVTSLMLILLFFPYTILLLTGPCLYRASCKRCAFFLRRIKPLLDSYYAPYKKNTRYWTGFLLVVRCVLYIVFSFNSLGGTNKSLLAIIVTFTGVAITASGRIYKNFYIDIMECFTFFNLIVLSAGTLVEMNKAALSYTLVGMVFATTIGTIVYHFHLFYITKSAWWENVKSKMTFKKSNSNAQTGNDQQAPANITPKLPVKAVTKTYIAWRESVLKD